MPFDWNIQSGSDHSTSADTTELPHKRRSADACFEHCMHERFSFFLANRRYQIVSFGASEAVLSARLDG